MRYKVPSALGTLGVRPRMRKLPLLVDARLVLRMGGESVVGDGEIVVVQLELLLACQALTPSHNFCLHVFIAFSFDWLIAQIRN